MVTVILDVDGVLNMPFMDPEEQPERAAANPELSAQLSTADIGMQTLVFNPSIVTRINELEGRGVRFVWCTSWFHNAVTTLSPVIGINGDWIHLGDSADIPLSVRDDFRWKLQLVQDFVSTLDDTEKIFWFDDDLILESEKPDWAIFGGEAALNWSFTQDNVTAVGANPDVGLTHSMLDAVEDAF